MIHLNVTNVIFVVVILKVVKIESRLDTKQIDVFVSFIGVRGLLWRRRMYSITTPPQVQARSTNTVAPAKTPGLLVF